MNVQDTIDVIPGVGPAAARRLQHIGVRTIADCIDYLPRSYDDYSKVVSIKDLRPGLVSIQATITSVNGRYVRRGMHITEAIASDETGSVRLVWFNQPYRKNNLKKGEPYYVSGEFKLRRSRFSIANPSIEQVSSFPGHTARIVPVYRQTKEVKNHHIRTIIARIMPVIESMSETLPGWLIESQQLLPRAQALAELHYPSSPEALESAKKRYGFEEVFELALASLINKRLFQSDTAHAIEFEVEYAKKIVAALPFTLTDEQRKALWQIYQDMEGSHPMNRLLEGDVGSGKTAVAALAALMAVHQGFQVALMAPTEILATQHFRTLHSLLSELGQESTLGLLLGSQSKATKSKLKQEIKTGKKAFLVGTHALITDDVEMKELGLVIIDEQHRFGVDQRKALQAKATYMPHVLHMTATPIPRSLALTLYGELDISLIKKKPAGREPVETEIAVASDRSKVNRIISDAVDAGRQVFVVCPFIEESDAIDGTAAVPHADMLQKRTFPRVRVGILHGKLPEAEKASTMEAFRQGNIDILVATTVVEVGVDVPNATLMIIESAERFGLAQLHQLRGRVGRGEHAGRCVVVLSAGVQPSPRIRAFARSQDGFELAELDLELRGPGAIYGTSQHGALDLRIATLSDVELIAAARESAQLFLDKNEHLDAFPHLAGRVKKLQAVTNVS